VNRSCSLGARGWALRRSSVPKPAIVAEGWKKAQVVKVLWSTQSQNLHGKSPSRFLGQSCSPHALLSKTPAPVRHFLANRSQCRVGAKVVFGCCGRHYGAVCTVSRKGGHRKVGLKIFFRLQEKNLYVKVYPLRKYR
jgi:hypothetical protein